VIARALAEAVFADAVRACDPAARVRDALLAEDVGARLAGRRRFGLAVGKAALAMARGAGPVEDGRVIAPDDDGVAVPTGWQLLVSSHPVPDARSLAAANAALALVARASSSDVVLALISGGASSLIEAPRGDLTLDELVEVTSAVMRAGAPIHELNAVRAALSRVKAGGLVRSCAAPVVTLTVSDVVGDDLAVIGSGPTIRGGKRRDVERDADLARVIAPMSAFARAAYDAMAARGIAATLLLQPLVGDVERVAHVLAAADVIVAWGEPTLAIPDSHGEGGRAQQLALELAKRLRGTSRSAFVAGSDGADGPRPRARTTPAGAFVDGATWDAIVGAGIEPQVALDRRDAGTALEAVGALVVTGPTGGNHADLVIIG
jgi:hydroxypyruvate reductase